jgi:hypothetical protein
MMLNDPGFMRRLQLAGSDPSSTNASTMLRQILPILTIAEGRQVTVISSAIGTSVMFDTADTVWWLSSSSAFILDDDQHGQVD